MNAESRRTKWHDDFPNTQSIPPYLLPHGEVAAPRVQWALAYADLGWPVLPLHASTKRPATRRGLHDASTDPSQIRSWWTYMPLSNIGLLTGVAFDVLDCDVQIRLNGEIKHTSAPSLHRLNDLGLIAGCTGTALTRHGGLHLFFPASGSPTRHFHEQHLDLLGQGSYIVAPPGNVLPDNDIRGPGWYSWLNFPELFAPSASALDFGAVDEAVVPRQVPSRGQIRRQGSTTHLANFVRNTPEGARNNRTYWALCRALETGQSIDAITKAAVVAGLPVSEVATVVRSARRTVGV